jgi:hypothetical protein
MNASLSKEYDLLYAAYYGNSTAQHSIAQHSIAQHSTAQHSTAQHSTAQHSTAQHSTAQHSTAQHSTAQHSIAQHSIAQHSKAQHSTEQSRAVKYLEWPCERVPDVEGRDGGRERDVLSSFSEVERPVDGALHEGARVVHADHSFFQPIDEGQDVAFCCGCIYVFFSIIRVSNLLAFISPISS